MHKADMLSEVTYDIKVTVETFFQPQYSKPLSHEYLFAYRVTIFNGSSHTVKLLRRHWYIYDANGVTREVEGEGVIGVQPVLLPGESHQYVSGCDLPTDIGKMKGTYLMERLDDKKNFYINIPEFKLVAPQKMN